MMSGGEVAAAGIAVRDIPTENETTTYVARLIAAGGTAQPSVINAVNSFVHAGKVNGWWSKIKDCCWFVGPDLTSALVKLVQAPGTASSAENRTSGVYYLPGNPTAFPWTGPGFQESDYQPAAGLNKPTYDPPFKEIGSQFIPTDHGLSATNFSFGIIMESFDRMTLLGGLNIHYPSSVGIGNQFTFMITPYAFATGSGLGFGGAPLMQWCESDSVACSYSATEAIGAADGNAFQHYESRAGQEDPSQTPNAEFTLYQIMGFGLQGGFCTLGGYFLGEFIPRTELESLTQEMKLLHHRAHGISKQELWCGLGDSITAGLAPPEPWLNGWFGKSARARGARVNNSGIIQCKTLGPNTGGFNTDLPIEHRYANLKYVGADYVTVMCGTNDMDPALGGDSTTDGDPTIIATYKDALVNILTTIKSWGATAIMLSPPWNGRDSLTKQSAYSTAAIGAAAIAGVRRINVFQSMVDTGNPNQFFPGDGKLFSQGGDPVHPTYSGHNFISTLLLCAIEDGRKTPLFGWGRMSIQARLGREALVQPFNGAGEMSVDATVV